MLTPNQQKILKLAAPSYSKKTVEALCNAQARFDELGREIEKYSDARIGEEVARLLAEATKSVIEGGSPGAISDVNHGWVLKDFSARRHAIIAAQTAISAAVRPLVLEMHDVTHRALVDLEHRLSKPEVELAERVGEAYSPSSGVAAVAQLAFQVGNARPNSTYQDTEGTPGPRSSCWFCTPGTI
jgi:hypothetical protein